MSNTNTEEKINQVIAEKITPVLNQHMGDAVLSAVEDGKVYIKFTGNCRGCYASEDTLNNIVRPILLEEVEGITDVILDDSVSEDLLDFARQLLSKSEKK